jgi:hypothetical protein
MSNRIWFASQSEEKGSPPFFAGEASRSWLVSPALFVRETDEVKVA